MKVDFSTQSAGSTSCNAKAHRDADSQHTLHFKRAVELAMQRAVAHFPADRTVAIVEVRLIAAQE